MEKINDVMLKKDKVIKNNNDISLLVEKKMSFFQNIIQKTIIHVQTNKKLDILGISDVNLCIDRLYDLNKKIKEIANNLSSNLNSDLIINELQLINNELSSLFKNYGTDSFEDLLLICFGNNNKITTNEKEQNKYDLLKKYFHPTSYKVINKKDESNKICDLSQEEKMKNLDCFDVSSSFKQFYMKLYGIKLFIHSDILKKSLIIYGRVDDIIIDFVNNYYITSKQQLIMSNMPSDNDFKGDSFKNFLSSLLLKDYLIYDNHIDYYNKFIGLISQSNTLKQKQLNNVVKEFITDDLLNKRNTIICLLIKTDCYDNQYLAYLLYDLLSNDSNGVIDTYEQTVLYDSFSWSMKQHFKQAMKKTVQYTNELSNFDINKIPLEQQICLIKASDSVKEKAMIKLKEIKTKSEDSGSKARQYLDGLLKIPFSVYKREPVLNIIENVKNNFKEIYRKYNVNNLYSDIKIKDRYTSIEVVKYIKQIQTGSTLKINDIENLIQFISKCDKKNINKIVVIINTILKKYNLLTCKIKTTGLTKTQIIDETNKIITFCKNSNNPYILDEVIIYLKNHNGLSDVNGITNINVNLINDVNKLNEQITNVTNYISNVKITLDEAVHGHNSAKKQIEKIIGQWINGEQDGYCFGFEGPPGVGKTSLAKKGLSSCLKDENGVSRPFAMIQMGGDSNGSTLHGHNYTYVGSTWGSIVQILIDKKCMNPIIFIDEVDKISKTEHGKEIVGILTHLLDPAQNDCFQDKYFSGIDLDLSKALFILSYNDAEAIDKILLDRVHRIKFSNLTVEDKLIILKTHILPEVYKKMGLEDMIYFSDEVLNFIIEEYTSESGVRKLKEIIFEIVGEINLDSLKNNKDIFDLPINITIENVKTKFLKDKYQVKNKQIHSNSVIGVINGLWANSLGKGGVIPIQVNWRPSEKFLHLYLTGLQGDVMKESMNVALTLAWNLTSDCKKKEISFKYATELNGLHIHCPEGAVPKDGPSAGTAITSVIYSLLNSKKIKYNIAITGEISLDGFVTEIGGLDLKILGAIKAGIKEILFPVENLKDYKTFMEKYNGNPLIEDIKFHPVNTINEVFELIFED